MSGNSPPDFPVLDHAQRYRGTDLCWDLAEWWVLHTLALPESPHWRGGVEAPRGGQPTQGYTASEGQRSALLAVSGMGWGTLRLALKFPTPRLSPGTQLLQKQPADRVPGKSKMGLVRRQVQWLVGHSTCHWMPCGTQAFFLVAS